MDSEIVNVVIAVAVIYFVVRWATGGGSNPSANPSNALAKTLGFRPKNVTPEMIASVQSAFPDIPQENIHYDLLRTGSVEMTVNRLLERGYLDAPPPSYRQAFPSTSTSNASDATSRPAGQKSTPAAPAKSQSLIERFHLESKVAPSAEPATTEWDGKGPIPSAAKGKGRAEPLPKPVVSAPTTGKAAWEATPEKRQEALRKKKEEMILAARRRMLEKESQ